MTEPATESRLRPLRSTGWRANWSGVIGGLGGVIIFLTIAIFGSGIPEDRVNQVVLYYLIFWPIFSITYVAWTHVAYSRRSREELRSVSVREASSKRRWYFIALGFGGPADWTISAALFAVGVTVAIAVTPGLKTSALVVVLGLVTVACSWAMMVYAFALDYLHLDLAQERTNPIGASVRPHIDFDFDEEPQFSDYLTFAIMVATMAVAVPGRIASRAAWRIIRTNVILAFVFNTVIVAMTVSILFGGIGG
ncbi:hypothetical protein K8P10_000610 [Leucobacter sp. Psy1]|uniref:DUF1345 domain-containing protein n=1 Tax=Leucobacter sp. Psy1 TaxID=2875729 RepID=UPI001CD1F5F6|nr:DUF1345 domain-containing protein [Leucobacter sp. Psy1]UBH05099.1 hypothetical protein K8P10_000610 [Leucobacter sp. Psy1]